MRHSIRACFALPVFLLLAAGAVTACGGVAETGNGAQGANEGGAGGRSSQSVTRDAGVNPNGRANAVGAGGANGGGCPGCYGAGGWVASGGFSTGGLPDYSLSGGRAGWQEAPDTGPACMDVYTPMSWMDRCAPNDPCIDLNSPTLPSATDSDAWDGSIVARMSVDERSFCSAPSPSHKYLFAFEETGATYDDFNVVTGSAQCQGKSLAFLGIGGVGDAPLTPVRTHCFSIPGDVLQSRLAVVALDPNAHVSNLRAVSSCPCAYPLPYNVSSCPGVNGGGGHPNCG